MSAKDIMLPLLCINIVHIVEQRVIYVTCVKLNRKQDIVALCYVIHKINVEEG